MVKKKKIDNAVYVFIHIFQSLLFPTRRPRLIHRLFFPLVSAIAGCLLFLFALLSFLSPPIINHHFNRNLIQFNKNSVKDDGLEGGRSLPDKEILFRVPKDGGNLGLDIWRSQQSQFYYGCCNASDYFQGAELRTHPDRYLMIVTSGGLNQQRTGITDAVVAAHILNATLVVPKLDKASYWKDKSNFSEIFNVDQFISSLSKDVKIIKDLPTIGGRVVTPYNTRVPRKCTPECYLSRLLPKLEKKRVIQLTKFDYRLSNRLEPDLQRLRCRVNYHSLRFTDPILEMGRALVERMRMKSKHFVALHLRFESDMLAFSGCDYGGGEKEKKELGQIQRRWKTLHKRNPEKERRQGRCPLTPEEVGLMLRALGYGSDIHIYVASGDVYGGEETLAPLKSLFPNFHSKDTIATKQELKPFFLHSSRMAALDFIVCDESDVFITNNNGNMARMLAGRRKYFGHKPTIRPNAKKLYKLFMNRDNTTWDEFASKIRTFQIGFMGEPNEVKPGRGEFHENPAACICKKPKAKAKRNISLLNSGTNTRNETNEATNENIAEDEQDWSDTDDMDINESRVGRLGLTSQTTLQPEIEEMFSD